MATVGVRALKQNASAVVAAAASGEEVTITDRGRPVAQLVPLRATRLDELLVSGRARAPRRSLADLPAPCRRRPGTQPLSSTLADQRDAERY